MSDEQRYGMYSADGGALVGCLIEAVLPGIERLSAEQIVRAAEHVQDVVADLGYGEAHDSEVRWAILRRLSSAAVPYEALRDAWLPDYPALDPAEERAILGTPGVTEALDAALVADREDLIDRGSFAEGVSVGTPGEPLTVDYWRLTRALGRALDHEGPEFWRVAKALGDEFPEFSWHNAMTDGGSPAPPPRRYLLFAHQDYYPAGGADDLVHVGFDTVAAAEEYMTTVRSRSGDAEKAHLLDTAEGVIVRDWRRDGEGWRDVTAEEADRVRDWRQRRREARIDRGAFAEG